MGQILTPAFESSRHRPALVNAHRDEHGSCSVMLGTLAVLANYASATATGASALDIEIVSVTVSGHEVPPEFFDAQTLKTWADDIAADRASDERMARDAAEYGAWEALQ